MNQIENHIRGLKVFIRVVNGETCEAVGKDEPTPVSKERITQIVLATRGRIKWHDLHVRQIFPTGINDDLDIPSMREHKEYWIEAANVYLENLQKALAVAEVETPLSDDERLVRNCKIFIRAVGGEISSTIAKDYNITTGAVMAAVQSAARKLRDKEVFAGRNMDAFGDFTLKFLRFHKDYWLKLAEAMLKDFEIITALEGDLSSGQECQACQDREGKTWEGAEPKCAFKHGAFDADNWNCATVSKIPQIANRLTERTIEGVNFHLCATDQRYSTIYTQEIEGFRNSATATPLCLWVGWYKNRGRTEGMYLMFENAPPRPPTQGECLTIINHYILGVIDKRTIFRGDILYIAGTDISEETDKGHKVFATNIGQNSTAECPTLDVEVSPFIYKEIKLSNLRLTDPNRTTIPHG